MDISVIIPLLNEEESLPELASWIDRVMVENQFSYEILMIDDGSSDRSWEVIQALYEKNTSVKGIKFQRNYGKAAALHTGFQECNGDVVITMDADLQDNPEEIPELYQMIISGYDLVSGWKKKRYDPLSKTIPTKLYNGVTSLMSGIKLHDFNCGLKAYRRNVVKTIEVYGEMHRYIPVIAKWSGFKKIGEKVVQHQARKFGETKYGGIKRFIFGPLDLLSIMFVSNFRRRPMHLFGFLGAVVFMIGFAITVGVIGEKIYSIYNNIPIYREVTAQPLFYLALVCIILGTQLFLAGFIGEMVARNAPDKNQYIVDKRINLH